MLIHGTNGNDNDKRGQWWQKYSSFWKSVSKTFNDKKFQEFTWNGGATTGQIFTGANKLLKFIQGYKFGYCATDLG